MLTEWIDVRQHKSSSVFKCWCSVSMSRLSGGYFQRNFLRYTARICPIRRRSIPSGPRLYLSCGWNLSYPDVSANTKFADSFPKEELITETKAVKIDKPFLLSALLSVGSLKRRCSHGSLSWQAWPTTGIAQRGCSRDGCRRRNPDYCHWQLVDLRWLVSGPLPFFCLSGVQKPAWQR